MSQPVSSKTTFHTICPILTSYDFDKTEAFYREKLGFVTDAKYPNYLIMSRENLTLHFTDAPGDSPADTVTQCYIYVDDVQPIYEECKAAGVVHPNGDLADKPHGMREFCLLDEDHNAIFFGQMLDTSPPAVTNNPTEVIPRQD